jgi:hypothetical protein
MSFSPENPVKTTDNTDLQAADLTQKYSKKNFGVMSYFLAESKKSAKLWKLR